MNVITNNKLHCIHYIPRVYLEGGGVVRFVLDICQVLSNQNIKVTLITQEAIDAPAHWYNDDNQPNVLEIKQKKLPGRLITGSNLNKIAELFTENTVINFHIPWVLSNFQLARLANKQNVPYIVTPHGSLDTWSMEQKRLKKQVFWFLFGRKHYRNAKSIHYTAGSERDQAEKYIQKSNVTIIPCLFDTSDFKNLPEEQLARDKFSEISKKTPNLLFLSRLHPKKGADVLVRATKILIDKGVEVNVLLAGPYAHTVKNYPVQLQALVDKLGLSDFVHLIGMVKGQEKLSLFRLADIFVLPTHQENFGFVLVEAMVCGTPVITSYGVDIWQEIQRGGATISDNKPELIATAIENLLTDRYSLQQIGDQCRGWVLTTFDAEKLAKNYVAMYSDAVQ